MPDDLAEKLIDDGRHEEAVKRLEEVLGNAEEPGLRVRLGSCLFRLGKFGDALANARKAAEKETPHREDALLLIGYCLKSLKRWREASKMFVGFSDTFPNSDRRRIARFTAALCLEELDDWNGAAEIYASIGDDEADFRTAICFERAGKKDEAAQLFEDFIAKHEGSAELLKVRFRLGSMRLRQNRVDEAIAHLEAVIQLGEPGNFIAALAEQLLERARLKKADIQKNMKKYGN